MASIGSSTTASTQLDDKEFRKELFEGVQRRKWKKFVELYKSNPEKHSTKITNSEDTALHMAITQGAPADDVVKLVDEIKKTTNETAKGTLSARNNREDTPLHCAAARGSRLICERIVLPDTSSGIDNAVVRLRNKEGESPLFLAALNGHKNTFLFLHSVCTRRGYMDSSLWTRKSRDTILHLTIHRQYFDLSLIIIDLYKGQNIANIRNSKGLTPLQTLACVPTAFKSGTYLTWWDRLCYDYIRVPPPVLPEDSLAIDIERQTKYAKDDALAESHETRGSLIRKKKEKHVWAAQIMEKLIELNSQYDYSADDISPFQDLSEEDELLRLYQEKMVESGIKENKDVYDDEDQTREEQKPTTLLIATKFGLIELVKKILEIRPVAIHDKTPSKKRNIVLVAAENRQPHILNLLMDMEKSLWPSLREAVDEDGNNAMHLAATLPEHMPWEIHGSAMQMQWEVKWFEYVREITPSYLDSQENNEGKTPEEIFAKSHRELVKQGNKWLKDTTSSYSIVAALTAGVTYSTSYSVPGGTDDSGKPILQGHPAFKIFSITALLSFCFSITSLAAFLAVYSSRMQPKDFQKSLPLKLCLGLTSFFVSIITMLVSFCAAHSFELSRGNKHQFNPWYTITLLPLCFYAAAQVPLYLDLLRASFTKVPEPKHKGGYVPI